MKPKNTIWSFPGALMTLTLLSPYLMVSVILEALDKKKSKQVHMMSASQDNRSSRSLCLVSQNY